MIVLWFIEPLQTRPCVCHVGTVNVSFVHSQLQTHSQHASDCSNMTHRNTWRSICVSNMSWTNTINNQLHKKRLITIKMKCVIPLSNTSLTSLDLKTSWNVFSAGITHFTFTYEECFLVTLLAYSTYLKWTSSGHFVNSSWDAIQKLKSTS